jgi:hypothetical protein
MLILVAAVVTAQGGFLQRLPWWQPDVTFLRDEGFYYSDGLGRRPPIRWYVATKTAEAINQLSVFTDLTEDQAKGMSKGRDGKPAVLEQTVKHLERTIPRIRRLARGFSFELNQLGLSAPYVEGELARIENRLRWIRTPHFGEANGRFLDVPKGHWADEAVHGLRREGILRGYPDGRFGAP